MPQQRGAAGPCPLLAIAQCPCIVGWALKPGPPREPSLGSEPALLSHTPCLPGTQIPSPAQGPLQGQALPLPFQSGLGPWGSGLLLPAPQGLPGHLVLVHLHPGPGLGSGQWPRAAHLTSLMSSPFSLLICEMGAVATVTPAVTCCLTGTLSVSGVPEALPGRGRGRGAPVLVLEGAWAWPLPLSPTPRQQSPHRGWGWGRWCKAWGCLPGPSTLSQAPGGQPTHSFPSCCSLQALSNICFPWTLAEASGEGAVSEMAWSRRISRHPCRPSAGVATFPSPGGKPWPQHPSCLLHRAGACQTLGAGRACRTAKPLRQTGQLGRLEPDLPTGSPLPVRSPGPGWDKGHTVSPRGEGLGGERWLCWPHKAPFSPGPACPWPGPRQPRPPWAWEPLLLACQEQLPGPRGGPAGHLASP